MADSNRRYYWMWVINPIPYGYNAGGMPLRPSQVAWAMAR